jgi:hypothetical protein
LCNAATAGFVTAWNRVVALLLWSIDNDTARLRCCNRTRPSHEGSTLTGLVCTMLLLSTLTSLAGATLRLNASRTVFLCLQVIWKLNWLHWHSIGIWAITLTFGQHSGEKPPPVVQQSTRIWASRVLSYGGY